MSARAPLHILCSLDQMRLNTLIVINTGVMSCNILSCNKRYDQSDDIKHRAVMWSLSFYLTLYITGLNSDSLLHIPPGAQRSPELPLNPMTVRVIYRKVVFNSGLCDIDKVLTSDNFKKYIL